MNVVTAIAAVDDGVSRGMAARITKRGAALHGVVRRHLVELTKARQGR